MNACTMLMCTVETFTTAAVEVNNTGAFPFNDMRFMFNRFTNGPLGFSFTEASTGVIRDVTIRDTHDDAVTQMLEFNISGTGLYSTTAAVRQTMRGDRRFYMVHRGLQWPVRFAVDDDVESASGRLAYTSTSNQVIIREPADSTTGDLVANDITSLTNGAGTERVNFSRLRTSGPTAHTTGNDAASAGWGSTASITIEGTCYDARGRVTVSCSGTGIAANPTLTLTFANGAWPTAPFVTCSRGDSWTTNTGAWRVTNVTTTTVEFTFVGTPDTGRDFTLDFMVIG